LSHDQVLALSLGRDDVLVNNETGGEEAWQACTTPIDEYDSGSVSCSNYVFVISTIESIAPANGTRVDRDNQSSTMSDYLQLNVSVSNPNAVVGYYANLTTPSGFFQENISLGFSTPSGGMANLTFDPDASFYAGNYTWWAYYRNLRQRNIGWRIDYAFLTKDIKLKNVLIEKNVMGSDHCPYSIDITF